MREDLLEVALGGAHPLLAEVLHLDAGDADLPGQALHEVGLAGPDPPGEEVAHRDRLGAAALQQDRVRAQPGLGLVVPRDVVEGARRLQELEAARRLLLDELLLHPREVGPGDPLAAGEGALHQGADRDPREPDQLVREDLALHLGGLLELRDVGDEVLHEGPDVFGRRERDADLGAVGALDQAAVEVGEVLGDEHRGHEGARDLGVRGPLLDLDEGLAEVGDVDGVALGGDEVGVVEDDRDPEGRRDDLAVLDLRAPAGEGEDAVDDLEGPLGVARQLVPQVQLLGLLGHDVEGGGRAPEGVHPLQEAQDLLDPLVGVGPRRVGRLDPHATAPVVADDHVEGLEHGAGQEVGDRHEVRAALAVRRRHQVEDVAVEDELAGGAGLEDLAHLLRPRGKPSDFSHSILLDR